MPRPSGLWLLAILLGLVSPAAAQTPTMPMPRSSEPCGVPSKAPATELTNLHQRGQWQQLRQFARTLFAEARESCPTVAPGTADFTLVVWQGKPAVGDRTVFVILVPPSTYDDTLDPFQLVLPGVGGNSEHRLLQAFVADAPSETLAAVYVSTQQRNPLTDQIPAVAAAMVDPLLALASVTRGPTSAARAANNARAARTAAQGWLTIADVPLPFERASIELHMNATVPPTPGVVRDAASDLRDKMQLLDVRYSECAQTLAGTLFTTIETRSTQCERTLATNCLDLSVLDAEFDNAYQAQNKACGTTAADRRALQLVDREFRELLAEGSDRKLPSKKDLKDIPLGRFSFGVVEALMMGTFASAPRVTVDDGVLVADPLGRLVTMAVVNGSFRPYNPAAFSISRQERLRWFAGAAITPSFGVAGGISALVVRGFAINAGVVVLGTTGAADGQSIGSPPVGADDPYSLEAAGGFFLGASFNFK